MKIMKKGRNLAITKQHPGICKDQECDISIIIGYDQLLVICGKVPTPFLIGRSPGLRIIVERPPSRLLSGINGLALPVHSDEFVQESHLFPF